MIAFSDWLGLIETDLIHDFGWSREQADSIVQNNMDLLQSYYGESNHYDVAEFLHYSERENT